MRVELAFADAGKEPCDAFDAFRLDCVEYGKVWDQAAETARVAGDFETARSCSVAAQRCYWFVWDEDDLRAPYNRAAAALEHAPPREVPLD